MAGCLVFDAAGQRRLKQMHELFVVTTLDKLSNAFNVVCLKYYVAAMQHNLQTVFGDLGDSAVDVAAGSLAAAATASAGFLFENSNSATLHASMAKTASGQGHW